MYSEGPNFSGSIHYSSPHQQAIQAMNIVLPLSTNHLSQPSSSSVWLANTGATNHMSADLSIFSLIAPYPTNDRVQTTNGEGLLVSHVGTSIIPTSTASINMKLVLYVPQLTQNLLSVHRLCLDNNYRLIFDAFSFGFRIGPQGGSFTQDSSIMDFITCQLFLILVQHLSIFTLNPILVS